MSRSALLGPSPLDTRADSPVGDQPHLSAGSPTNRSAPHGLPTPANDVPSSGFTAVNGDRMASFRSDKSAQPPAAVTNSDSDSDRRAVARHRPPTSNSYHNWRPDERRTSQDGPQPHSQSPLTHKRRRDTSSTDGARARERDGSGYFVAAGSPKRRMTAREPNGISSPSRLHEARSYTSEREDLPPATTGTYVREGTPVFRSDRAEPPPPPPPEAEAVLAASLQQSLHAQQSADHQSEPPQEASNSPEDNYEQLGLQSHGTDSGQQGDGLDPKKRKRNFSNRTKTGCHTCRGRKKKCDEAKPTCENCRRGGFPCGGYGPKPPGGAKLATARTEVPLQAKQPYQAVYGPAHFPPEHLHYHHPTSPRATQHHWDPNYRAEAYPPPPQHLRYNHPPPSLPDHRPPSGRDSWPMRQPWGSAEPPHPYPSDRLPSVDSLGMPPMHYGPDRRPPLDPFGPSHAHSPYRPQTGAPTVITSADTASTRSGHAAPLSQITVNEIPTERSKMLAGQRYSHFSDAELISDRLACKRAVESYNNACAPSSTAKPAELERRFKSIWDPSARIYSDPLSLAWTGPTGSVGHRTVVEAPFNCDFGYNIHLGSDVLVQANCFMQDACPVIIGDRTHIGPNVKFYCMTTSVDANLRARRHGSEVMAGYRSEFFAGAIRIEEDCLIGADVIIMPFRTIGKGAVVGAGSVVTRDVKPHTVVAGNPAKVIKRRIDSGQDADRHDDAIEEENRRMLEWMNTEFSRHGRNSGRSRN